MTEDDFSTAKPLARNLKVKPDDEEAEVPIGFDQSPDLEQAFDFRMSNQSATGFIVSMTLGGTPVAADFSMVDPTLLGTAPVSATAATGTAASIRAVGPLRRVSWELGDTDPIEFEARISARAKQQLMLVQYAGKQAIDVKVAWVIYEHDPVAKKYFVAFSNSSAGSGGAPAQGQLLKRGRNLELRVGSAPATEVSAPLNYSLSFSIVPKDNLTQTLYLATGSLLRVNKPWGRVKAS